MHSAECLLVASRPATHSWSGSAGPGYKLVLSQPWEPGFSLDIVWPAWPVGLPSAGMAIGRHCLLPPPQVHPVVGVRVLSGELASFSGF